MNVALLIVSDTRSAGTRADETTAAARARLEASGAAVTAELVPDERREIGEAIRRLAADADVVLTSGGTGLGPRDVTPEATLDVIDRQAPGIAEMLRAATAAQQPKSWLSRGVAGQLGGTLVVNCPGSPRGVQEYLDLLLPLLGHAVAVASGGGHK